VRHDQAVYDQEIGKTLATLPESKPIRTLPGIGERLAPELVAALGPGRDSHPKRSASAQRQRIGCSPKIAGILTQLTTFQHRLPQGAATSTMLANLSLLPMHQKIGHVATQMGLRWTFYIDDIAISGRQAPEAIDKVIRIIQRHGHAVRRQKIRCMPNNVQQKLTGSVINRKVSAGRQRIREIREQIMSLANQQQIFEHELRSLRGRIAQVRWLCPFQGAFLTRLEVRYLPKVGINGKKPRTDEIRFCDSFRRHRI
jgi:hypothetical protein